MFLYELNSCGLKSRCSNLNFKYRFCFEGEIPWHSSRYRLYIQSKRVCGMIKTHSSISDLLLWWKDVFSKFFFESVFKQPQKQPQEVKIHRKTPVQEPLFKESCRPASCNFLKKETLAHVFSYEFCEISKNTFFTEHLRSTSVNFT